MLMNYHRTPLRIFSFDLATETDEVLFECNMPPVFLFRMMLRGSFVLAPVSPTGAKTMLLDWKNSKGVLVQYIDTEVRAIPSHFAWSIGVN